LNRKINQSSLRIVSSKINALVYQSWSQFVKGNLDDFQQSIYRSPIGQLIITQSNGVVQEMRWIDTPHQLQLIEHGDVKQWLDGYFSGQCGTEFSFTLKPQGTLFQQRVWHVMSQIAVGQTLTYGDIAKLLKSSAQAVGNACRCNPIVVMIPCHRVLSASGNGGYAGQTQGVMMQRKLGMLALELGVDPKEIVIDEQ